ncbi:MAG: aminopeptidase P family protein [Sphingomonadales bacterium]|nr:aminopeptidase P family protein [Sphingomonadales bacterium]
MRITDFAENPIDDRKLAELNNGRLHELMRARGVDALFVIAPDNWRYATALPMLHSIFSSMVNAALVCLDKPFPTLFPLQGFGSPMSQRAPWMEDIEELPMEGTGEGLQPMMVDKWPQIIANKLSQLGLSKSRIAVDPMTPFALKEAIQNRLQTAQIVDGGEILRQARLIKNEEELKALRNACLLADIAMEDAFKAVRPGASELDIAAAAEHSFRVHGAEYSAFTPQVFSGLNALMPYNSPSSRLIRNGELVRIDIGCCSHGYHSCFGRTVYVGSPDDQVQQAYAAVHHALAAGISAARPGVTNIELHQIMSRALDEHSAGKYDLGSYGGHGLGAGIHENPMIGSRGAVEEMVLEANMCIALEPSVMVPGRGWLGLEDNIIITSSGCEVMTTTRFELDPKA